MITPFFFYLLLSSFRCRYIILLNSKFSLKRKTRKTPKKSKQVIFKYRLTHSLWHSKQWAFSCMNWSKYRHVTICACETEGYYSSFFFFFWLQAKVSSWKMVFKVIFRKSFRIIMYFLRTFLQEEKEKNN